MTLEETIAGLLSMSETKAKWAGKTERYDRAESDRSEALMTAGLAHYLQTQDRIATALEGVALQLAKRST